MSTFPACQVCYQQFSLKGPIPFLLPCLHSVCETCVTSAAGGVVSCSNCHKDVTLTDTRLQKDVITEKEILHLAVKHHPEMVLCTHEDDGNQAVCWCKECEDFFCEHCEMIHDRFKITRKHVVEDIADLQPGSFDVDEYCSLHPKHILDMWDEQCCISICRKCQVSAHAEHKPFDFDDAVKIAKREVAGYWKEIQSSVTQQGTNLTTIETDLQASDETCDELTEKIAHAINDMRTVIDQREKKLQIELQQHQEKVRRELQEKKHTSEDCQKKCQTISNYISKTLQYSSRHDIMFLKHIIQSKARECIRSAQAIVHESPPLPKFNTEGLEKIKSALAGFGSLPLNDYPAVTEQINGLYILTTGDSDVAFLLNCMALEFSHSKYNIEYVHINTEDELINRAQSNTPHSHSRLKKYRGTSSTVPLPQCGSTQYFEIKTRLGIDKALSDDNLLLEIGLARKEEQDQHYCIDACSKSYSLTVAHCPKHSSICREVRRHNEHLLCQPDTLENTPGTSDTLHFGVVYDSARGCIAFLDVKDEKIVGVIEHVDSSVALWPMFGVYNPSLASVGMSLVVGSDIDMTKGKKAFVVKCLS